MNVKHIPNFIKASAKHLPFRNDVFETVTAFEVIEHLNNPFLAIKEMLRVCNPEIVLTCPHRFSWVAKMPAHISFFDITWFLKVAEKLGVRLKVDVTYGDFFNFGVIRFGRRILGLRVVMKK